MSAHSATALLPCPFCGEHLTVPAVQDAVARCDTGGCWMNDRAIGVSPDNKRHVAAWNTRAALAKARGEVK